MIGVGSKYQNHKLGFQVYRICFAGQPLRVSFLSDHSIGFIMIDIWQIALNPSDLLVMISSAGFLSSKKI